MSPFRRLDRWRAVLPEGDWTRIDVRDGEKGPLVLEVVKRRVQARTETGGTAPEELLFVTRELLSDGTYKHNYYVSNADPKATSTELVRVAKAAHRIEECLENAKGEAGMADYQVQTWTAWSRHQTLSLLAAWFLKQETRREKIRTPVLTAPQLRQLIGGMIEERLKANAVATLCRRSTRWLRRIEQARFYHHKSRNLLPPLKNQLRT